MKLVERRPERIEALPIVRIPAVILAGGLATRLRPITETIPKALVEVGGRPFIDYPLHLLRRNGIRRVLLCLGHLGDQVENHLRNSGLHDLEIRYSHDGPQLLGTGGALCQAAPLLDELFWVLYGDSYMDIAYPSVLAAFLEQETFLGLMTVVKNQDRWDRSNVVFRDGRLLKYDKRKPTAEMTHIDFGVALLRRTALERISPRRPADLADLYSQLVADGQMMGYEVTQRFFEIGSPLGLQETRSYLKDSAGFCWT